MDSFIGFKTATTEEMPQAKAALDPFHVIRLAGEALNQCRRRVQQELHSRPGQADDPLHKAHRTLHTGNNLLAPNQHKRFQCGSSRTSKPKGCYKTNTFCPITGKVTLPATRSVL